MLESEEKIDDTEIENDIQDHALWVLEMMDGDVYATGVKVSHREWLDNGFESPASDEQKAAAYHSASKKWQDDQIKSLMTDAYPHLKPATMDLILEEIHNLAEKFPDDTTDTDPIEIKLD